MEQMQQSIDDIMGFNPSNLGVFNTQETTNGFDDNIYKTNPVKFATSEDGVYRARVRIVYNPFNVKMSIVPQATYWLEDATGGFLVRSKLANGDKTCPLFTAWKKLWFSGDEEKKNWSKEMYHKTESQWVLIQILEDANRPELIGKFMVMKLPKAIYTKMANKMNPSAESKKAPVAIMDYLIGLPLNLEVQPGPDDPKAPERKQREINYDLCEFDTDYAPIIAVDGKPFFTENELELIDQFNDAKMEIAKAKSKQKVEAAQKKLADMDAQIKDLYRKAWNYVKENAVDLEKECAYQEWDEATTTRVQNWIDCVAQMQNPKTVTVTEAATPTAAPVSVLPVDNQPTTAPAVSEDDDLPF